MVLVALLSWIAYRRWKQSRITPEDRERQRRAWLAASGKMSDATLVDVQGDSVFYCYAVRGVEYTASQDVSRLALREAADLLAPGALAVKYDPRNPANSIVISEEWTGLRASKNFQASEG